MGFQGFQNYSLKTTVGGISGVGHSSRTCVENRSGNGESRRSDKLVSYLHGSMRPSTQVVIWVSPWVKRLEECNKSLSHLDRAMEHWDTRPGGPEWSQPFHLLGV